LTIFKIQVYFYGNSSNNVKGKRGEQRTRVKDYSGGWILMVASTGQCKEFWRTLG
jgi:hypothetical protein